MENFTMSNMAEAAQINVQPLQLPIVKDDLVFDVGAHKGEDSDFYLQLGYRVIGIEANPTLATELRDRFKNAIEEHSYVLIDKAISKEFDEVSFYLNTKLSVWGTANPKWALRNKNMGADSEKIQVKSIPFEHLISTYGCPRYLKIDIEGSDMLCVEALKHFKCRPLYISIESAKTSWLDLKKEFDELEKLGYSKFKVIDQNQHKAGRFVNRLGENFNYAFQRGSSGPFGEHLDGPWLTKRQALLRYIPIFILYKTIGDNKILRKIFARIPIVRRILNLVSHYDTHAMRDGVYAISARPPQDARAA